VLRRLALLGYALALLLAGTAEAPARAPRGWSPDVKRAIVYAKHRKGVVSFAVRTERRLYGWHVDSTAPSASVVKAMLMVAYLNRDSVRRRALNHGDWALLSPMIRRSDNVAATRVFGIVGSAGLKRLAHRVGMRHFAPATPIWGATVITAADQTKFFLHLRAFIPPRHRPEAFTLLRTVVPEQRWGIARVCPDGWKIYFKGGWGSGTGAVDHQVALLTRGDQRVSIAVLTLFNPNHAYGKATEEGVARRLLRGLAAR
jgi:Beta-lactamase enzyme family